MDNAALRRLVREAVLLELDISDVGNVCYAAGSTHVMKTCTVDGEKYFLKFSDDSLFDDFDPSLQVLVEYLAYRIYGLYAGIRIPKPLLVYDKSRRRVGIATRAVRGEMALESDIEHDLLGRMLSQGVYVDIFLANWDVIGTGSGNIIVNDDVATRIDPGGSLTFRAQGGRKGSKFNPRAGELSTMLTSGKGAALVFQHADLSAAAREFLAVPWSRIAAEIAAVRGEVDDELTARGMDALAAQWSADVDEISSILRPRHAEVTAHARHVLR